LPPVSGNTAWTKTTDPLILSSEKEIHLPTKGRKWFSDKQTGGLEGKSRRGGALVKEAGGGVNMKKKKKGPD